MSSITKEYIRNNSGVISGEVKYLIVSVGTSYEPIVLNISLLKPQKVLFLYTEKSEKVIDKVADFCDLKISQVEKRKVVETESIDVYREIKNCYIRWGEPDPVKRQELSNVYMLAKAYEHWDALEFNLSYDCMAKLNKSIDRDIKNSKHILFGNQIIVLRRQEQILWQLNKLYGW